MSVLAPGIISGNLFYSEYSIHPDNLIVPVRPSILLDPLPDDSSKSIIFLKTSSHLLLFPSPNLFNVFPSSVFIHEQHNNFIIGNGMLIRFEECDQTVFLLLLLLYSLIPSVSRNNKSIGWACYCHDLCQEATRPSLRSSLEEQESINIWKGALKMITVPTPPSPPPRCYTKKKQQLGEGAQSFRSLLLSLHFPFHQKGKFPQPRNSAERGNWKALQCFNNIPLLIAVASRRN